MKYFKIEASRIACRYEINTLNFNSVTENKLPFTQTGDNGEIRQYGICPSCLNPVQLIGIFKQIKRQPYGRHTGKDVNGMPKWNVYKYQHCPFAKSNDKAPINTAERGIITDDTVELYNLLKAQFDRVIYIITKDFGIKGSLSFWEKALIQFRESEGYCYPWLTESNLPYIFAFFGLQQQRPFKQRFAAGSDIYISLCKHPAVEFDDKDSKKYPRFINHRNQFADMYFRLTDHRQSAKEGEELTESIKFCVDDRSENKTVFEKRIVFDETYFPNLIAKSSNEDKRNRQLIDLAAEILPPIAADI